ncbi:MAG: ABC transporter permease [Chloroflexi bacterium]|nr:ABC transporter permease [Chloroflexota bacterium]
MTTERPPSQGRRLVALPATVWAAVALPFISIVLALLVGSIVILASEVIVPGHPFDVTLPVTAYAALFEGAFGGLDPIVNTIRAATPLVLAGLAVGLAFKAGLFNIGAQGQFLLGALGSVTVGVALNQASPFIAIPAALLAGMLAGAAWGFIPGFLKAISGAHEVVTTIMLNYVAVSVIAWAVSGPLDQPGSPSPITAQVGNAALPVIIGRNGHLGVLVALAAVLAVGWLLFRTTRGFEIRTVGANPDAARYAGMQPRLIVVLTMSLAGVLAGLAGATVVLGVTHYMMASFGTTVGFDSIAVALLGRSSPVGIVFAAILFGAMRAGAPLMQIQTGSLIPAELVDVLQATILLFLAAHEVIRHILKLRGVKAGLETTDTIARTYGRESV